VTPQHKKEKRNSCTQRKYVPQRLFQVTTLNVVRLRLFRFSALRLEGHRIAFVKAFVEQFSIL